MLPQVCDLLPRVCLGCCRDIPVPRRLYRSALSSPEERFRLCSRCKPREEAALAHIATTLVDLDDQIVHYHQMMRSGYRRRHLEARFQRLESQGAKLALMDLFAAVHMPQTRYTQH